LPWGFKSDLLRQLIAAVARLPESGQTADARSRLERLTERESEVAHAVGRGLSNAVAICIHDAHAT